MKSSVRDQDNLGNIGREVSSRIELRLAGKIGIGRDLLLLESSGDFLPFRSAECFARGKWGILLQHSRAYMRAATEVDRLIHRAGKGPQAPAGLVDALNRWENVHAVSLLYSRSADDRFKIVVEAFASPKGVKLRTPEIRKAINKICGRVGVAEIDPRLAAKNEDYHAIKDAVKALSGSKDPNVKAAAAELKRVRDRNRPKSKRTIPRQLE